MEEDSFEKLVVSQLLTKFLPCTE